MGILYFRPDGQLLAHVPGEERDDAFERHLTRQDIPFVVHRHDALTDAPTMDRGSGGGNPIAHVRTTWTRNPNGSLTRHRHLHHPDGREPLELNQEEDASNA